MFRKRYKIKFSFIILAFYLMNLILSQCKKSGNIKLYLYLHNDLSPKPQWSEKPSMSLMWKIKFSIKLFFYCRYTKGQLSSFFMNYEDSKNDCHSLVNIFISKFMSPIAHQNIKLAILFLKMLYKYLYSFSIPIKYCLCVCTYLYAKKLWYDRLKQILYLEYIGQYLYNYIFDMELS